MNPDGAVRLLKKWLADLKVGDEVGYWQYGLLQRVERVTRITKDYVMVVNGWLFSKKNGYLGGAPFGDFEIRPLTTEDRDDLAWRSLLKEIDRLEGRIIERMYVLKSLRLAVDVKAQLQAVLDRLWEKEG
jgi:hypothetical protein